MTREEVVERCSVCNRCIEPAGEDAGTCPLQAIVNGVAYCRDEPDREVTPC